MKGYTKDNVLYVFPQEVGQIPYVDSAVTAIMIQQEDLAAWKEANSDYASIMKAYNYNAMTVQKKVWADHLNDDIEIPLVSPELAWSAEGAWPTIGETNEFPTLSNPHSVTVTYTSSDTDKATIDSSTGEITLVTPGETVISAIFDGDDTYEAQTVTYSMFIAAAYQNITYTSDYSAIITGTDRSREHQGSFIFWNAQQDVDLSDYDIAVTNTSTSESVEADISAESFGLYMPAYDITITITEKNL